MKYFVSVNGTDHEVELSALERGGELDGAVVPVERDLAQGGRGDRHAPVALDERGHLRGPAALEGDHAAAGEIGRAHAASLIDSAASAVW